MLKEPLELDCSPNRDLQRGQPLTEPEVLQILGEIGLSVPCHTAFRDPQELFSPNFPRFKGERVVLKIVSRQVTHKSRIGGVVIIPNSPEAIQQQARDWRTELSGIDLEGFLLLEYVEYSPRFGNEILLGASWTDDFGPVLTLAPGGSRAETMTAALKPDRDRLIISPLLQCGNEHESLLETLALFEGVAGRSSVQEGQGSQSQKLEALGNILQRLSGFCRRGIPSSLFEIEINPLAWTGTEWVALDGFARQGTGECATEAIRPLSKMGFLLCPERIAIAGVSGRAKNPGRIILENTLAAGFDPTAISLLKPGTEEILGCRCYAGLSSLPHSVDLLVLALEARKSTDLTLEAIRQKKAHSIILIASGFEELSADEPNAARLKTALEIARRSEDRGPLINGGNCMGVRSLPGRYDTLFVPKEKLPGDGRNEASWALLSQSGAVPVCMLSRFRHLSPRYTVSLGNQLDLSMGDYLEWLADHDPVKVATVYIEGFKELDGLKFLRAARQLRENGGMVVLYSAGRTPAGRDATTSHTASISTSYEITRRLAEAAGVLVAESLQEFEDLTRLLLAFRDKRFTGSHLAALSNAGYECVTVADNLERLKLPPFSAGTRFSLEKLLQEEGLQALIRVQNPMDLTPMADDAVFEKIARTVLDDPTIDCGIIGCVPLSPSLFTLTRKELECCRRNPEDSIATRLAELWADSKKPWVCVVSAGPDYSRMVETLEESGVPVFREADRAARALERVCRHKG